MQKSVPNYVREHGAPVEVLFRHNTPILFEKGCSAHIGCSAPNICFGTRISVGRWTNSGILLVLLFEKNGGQNFSTDVLQNGGQNFENGGQFFSTDVLQNC